MRFRVTRSGYLFLAALTLVGAAAIASANNLLFLILAAMLATILISGVISRLTLAGLELQLTLPEHICARQAAVARIRMRNLKWFPSFAIRLASRPREAAQILASEIAFPVIAARGAVEASVAAVFPKRGIHKENLFVVSTRFPFGFFERRATISIQTEAVIFPALTASPLAEEIAAGFRGELEREERGMGSDFYRLRPYEFHESARYVDWKSTAHTGELQVREFAREQGRALSLFLDLGLPRNAAIPEDAIERAVECCAYVVWSLSNESARIRLRTAYEDLEFPEQTNVYALLGILALASFQEDVTVPVPDDPDADLIFTARSAQMEEAGWRAARIVEIENETAANCPIS